MRKQARPVAPEGSGKENTAPTMEHIDACRQNLHNIFQTAHPEVIIALGRTAIAYTLSKPLDLTVGLYVGNEYEIDWFGNKCKVYCTYHPSAVLHGNKQAYINLYNTFYKLKGDKYEINNIL